MRKPNETSFEFLSEPSDVNFGGNVHGGMVMKWIDQVAYTCARNWSRAYCVTVYVGGIRFYKSIKIGEHILTKATIIYTGKSSMHIAVDVFSKHIESDDFEKKTHCVIVFVAIDEQGKAKAVPKFEPENEEERQLEHYAIRLKELSATIEQEMRPFLT
jgi:acyl-CoA hydrolase